VHLNDVIADPRCWGLVPTHGLPAVLFGDHVASGKISATACAASWATPSAVHRVAMLINRHLQRVQVM
jgi:hypothetical protein